MPGSFFCLCVAKFCMSWMATALGQHLQSLKIKNIASMNFGKAIAN